MKQKIKEKLNNNSFAESSSKEDLGEDILSDEMVKKLDARIPSFNRQEHNEYLLDLFSQFN